MDGNTTLRVLFGLGMGAAACLVVVNGQTPPKPHAFEVASIKENVSGSDNASVRAQPGGRVSVSNNSLRNIIRNAYNVQNYQIVGGPDWINTVRWDITAKAPDDAPPQQLLLMLRTLLADRFKLVIRNETREMPIYALTLARADGRPGPAAALVEYGLRCHLRGCQGEGRGATADHQRPAHMRHAYDARQHDDNRRCDVRSRSQSRSVRRPAGRGQDRLERCVRPRSDVDAGTRTSRVLRELSLRPRRLVTAYPSSLLFRSNSG